MRALLQQVSRASETVVELVVGAIGVSFGLTCP